MLPEEKYFKLWSEKCKILCYINHDILVTMVTKRTRWPPLFLLKFTSATLKENLRKIDGVEIARSHYLKRKFRISQTFPLTYWHKFRISLTWSKFRLSANLSGNLEFPWLDTNSLTFPLTYWHKFRISLASSKFRLSANLSGNLEFPDLIQNSPTFPWPRKIIVFPRLFPDRGNPSYPSIYSSSIVLVCLF